MTRSSAEVPEEVGDYYDEDGFVYRRVPHSEAEPDWTLMTEDMQEHVQPLSKFDKRRFEANEKRKAASARCPVCDGQGRVTVPCPDMDAYPPGVDCLAIHSKACVCRERVSQ